MENTKCSNFTLEKKNSVLSSQLKMKGEFTLHGVGGKADYLKKDLEFRALSLCHWLGLPYMILCASSILLSHMINESIMNKVKKI